MTSRRPSSGPERDRRREQWEEWSRFVAEVRDRPGRPFAEHWRRFQAIHRDRGPELGPPPAWCPDEASVVRSNAGRLMAERSIESYEALHAWSIERREEFWRALIERLGIVFTREPEAIIDLAAGVTRPHWLPGARMNCVESCFTAAPDDVAVIVGSEGGGAMATTTYAELASLVERCAAGLVAHGFSAGDGIALYMPMNLECVIAYLGIVRAGCYVVSIADSFAPAEVGKRLEIAGARGIITVDRTLRGGKTIPLYERVCEAGAPRTIVIAARGAGPGDEPDTGLRNGDLRWDDVMAPSGADRPAPARDADPDDLTNVLFSSGTTGTPKAIPWTHLTPIKCAMDGHLHQDIRPRDVVAWPTNIGWMMGPWLIYAGLINRAAIALYEGVPTGSGFARFVRDAGVTMLGVVPSLVRAWRESGACDDTDWNGVRVFSSTGEPSTREDYLWLMSRAGYRAPVIEYCGGTEIGGGYATGTVVQPASPATFSTPALGLDLVILDDAGRPAAPGEIGEVYLVPPSIGLSQSLLNRDHDEVYHAGAPHGPDGEVLRRHGDEMTRLAHGYFRAQGRADDTMNLGGIKVSSLELERIIETQAEVYESAAVAVQPGGEGAEKLVVYVVLKNTSPSTDTAQLAGDLGKRIARELNPLFKIHDLIVVDSLPRTASNKLIRRTLRDRYMGLADDRPLR